MPLHGYRALTVRLSSAPGTIPPHVVTTDRRSHRIPRRGEATRAARCPRRASGRAGGGNGRAAIKAQLPPAHLPARAATAQPARSACGLRPVWAAAAGSRAAVPASAQPAGLAGPGMIVAFLSYIASSSYGSSVLGLVGTFMLFGSLIAAGWFGWQRPTLFGTAAGVLGFILADGFIVFSFALAASRRMHSATPLQFVTSWAPGPLLGRPGLPGRLVRRLSAATADPAERAEPPPSVSVRLLGCNRARDLLRCYSLTPRAIRSRRTIDVARRRRKLGPDATLCGSSVREIVLEASSGGRRVPGPSVLEPTAPSSCPPSTAVRARASRRARPRPGRPAHGRPQRLRPARGPRRSTASRDRARR